MKYRWDYQETHDIDWFFIYNDRTYHAASNGGRLPDIIDSGDNRELQVKIERLPHIAQPSFSKNINDLYTKDEDLSSFAEYAAKGFISLDCVEGTTYRIVAFPSHNESFDDAELRHLIPKLTEKEITILQ